MVYGLEGMDIIFDAHRRKGAVFFLSKLNNTEKLQAIAEAANPFMKEENWSRKWGSLVKSRMTTSEKKVYDVFPEL